MLKRPGANFKLEFSVLFSKLGLTKELICILAFPLYILHWCYTYTMCQVVKLPAKTSVSHMLLTWELITDSQINGKLNSSPDLTCRCLWPLKRTNLFFEKVCYVLVFSGTSGMIHSEQRTETLKLLSDFYYVKDSKVVPDSNICPCKHFPNLKLFSLVQRFFFLNEIKYLNTYYENCEANFLLCKIIWLGQCLKHPKTIAGGFSFELYTVKFAEIFRHHLYKKDW